MRTVFGIGSLLTGLWLLVFAPIIFRLCIIPYIPDELMQHGGSTMPGEAVLWTFVVGWLVSLIGCLIGTLWGLKISPE